MLDLRVLLYVVGRGMQSSSIVSLPTPRRRVSQMRFEVFVRLQFSSELAEISLGDPSVAL